MAGTRSGSPLVGGVVHGGFGPRGGSWPRLGARLPRASWLGGSGCRSVRWWRSRVGSVAGCRAGATVASAVGSRVGAPLAHG